MRTFCILTGLFIFRYSFLCAQHVDVGFQAGLNSSNIKLSGQGDTYKDISIYKPMATWNINAFIEFKGSGIVGLSFEPGYMQKGAIEEGTDSRVRFQSNYFQTPVLINLHFSESFVLSVGPEVAYLANVNIKSAGIKTKLDKEAYQNTELSALIGLGLYLSEHVMLGIRYNHDLTYFSQLDFTDSLGRPVGTYKGYNTYIQFLLRYKIT
jgi:hypothetical protein